MIWKKLSLTLYEPYFFFAFDLFHNNNKYKVIIKNSGIVVVYNNDGVVVEGRMKRKIQDKKNYYKSTRPLHKDKKINK